MLRHCTFRPGCTAQGDTWRAVALRSSSIAAPTRPASPNSPPRKTSRSKGHPFTRRRYVVLCLALAVLEKSERQTVLQRIADDIAAEFASEPALTNQGIIFDLTVREHRRDLVEVIKYLIGLNILTRVDGDEQQFVSSQQQDVLYNINSNLLTAMLNVRRGPSTIKAESTDERINAMVDETFPDTEDGRHRRLRTRLFHRLLDDPVVYYASLEDDERAYLSTQRPSIVREIENASGLIQEARKEGVAMIDPEDAMTDVRMPSEGTDGHATLLIAEYLANSLRSASAKPVRLFVLDQHTESLVEQFGTHWRKDASEPGAAGVLLFYRYDDQEFHFHQGRLLLRGNNGTGKSRVLALQLPFLLDGETSPHRVEPDGDAAKRFEWNLLMGKYTDRLGYTWIEFGRVDAGGSEHYLTLGCGVRAVSGRGIHGKWFFVTTRRVGQGLTFSSSQSNPLPKDSLIEMLGSDGQVFTTAADYRAEVNRRLFELQPERYEALIELLIELRRPKLSRNLDERMLSDALSNALPPVSQKIIMQVAEAMRGLEEDRVALESLESARQSTDSFLREYRRGCSGN